MLTHVVGGENGPFSIIIQHIAKLRTMFATHELPDLVISDVGTEFRGFPSANNIHHATSAPYLHQVD